MFGIVNEACGIIVMVHFHVISSIMLIVHLQSHPKEFHYIMSKEKNYLQSI